MRSFPNDIVVLDQDALIHVRLGGGKKNQIVQAKSFRLPAGTFAESVVTPALANDDAFAEVLRRVRSETGRWGRASLLLPDSWFRINLIDLPNLPDRNSEAEQIVRWSLKRTLPLEPEAIRLAFTVLSRTPPAAKVLAVAAVAEALEVIERAFNAAGIEIVLIEPLGLNIWNAVAAREPEETKDRLFVYVREHEFTTAVFRGAEPMFIRSRSLHNERSVEQELRLSASYLRDSLRTDRIAQCYLAGNRMNRELDDVLASAFSAPVKRVAVSDYLANSTHDVSNFEAELTACTGVFTG
jgi:type IV pilus assembly protein PilM